MELQEWYDKIVASHLRIRQSIRKTPLQFSFELSELGQANVNLKLESEQETGSFKLRGAFSKLTYLTQSNDVRGKGVTTTQSDDVREKGVTTASTGNHALACLHAMSKTGIKGTLFVPCNITPTKEEALTKRGAVLCKHGHDCIEAEAKARKTAEENGQTYISPYNDPDVIAGQGTIGLEILQDLPEVDAILVPVGGGGLIGGIAAYIKHKKPSVKIIGCQPEMSKVMYDSVLAGYIVEEESFDTLSDGTAGGIEPGAMTFDLCKKYVDEWLVLSEEQIAKGVYFMMDKHHKIVEGAAGLSVGGYLANAERFKGQNVAIVVCGSNISMQKIQEIINSQEKKR